MVNLHRALKAFFSLILIHTVTVNAQSLPIGTPLLEDALRRLQISGKQDSLGSFMIRPLSTSACISFDSLYNPGEYLQRNKGSLSQRFAHGKGVFRLLPAMLTQQYNSHHPYGWNDGSMIQAKGYQVQASAGIYASLGMLSVQFRPEFIYAQNSRFETFPEWHSDSLWHQYYERSLNWIDNPERYGDKSYRKIFPGQSSVRLNYKKLSLGVSTENLWWGPGIRNSILMSNTAPGFAHITFNTTAPIKTPIGSLEWQVISGLLQNSSILPPDTGRTFNGVVMYQPKRDESRYLNGMVLTWQPKWLSNFYLGFSRVFYLYKTDIQSGLDGYLPIIGTFFKGATNNEDEKQRDQMLSFFFRLVLPKEKAEVYGEFGRNDHSQNTRDFLLEPEHSRAYVMGLKKIFDVKKYDGLEFMMEFSSLQNTNTTAVRAYPTWYAHHQVRHGYTNLGQVIGAGIGPGSNSQIIGLTWLKGVEQFGFSLERVLRDNDFYYSAFSGTDNPWAHWVDLSANFNRSWHMKRFIYQANLSLIKSYGYQWRFGVDPVTNQKRNADFYNMHLNFSVLYRL